jgi:hypothetical protein
MPPLYEFIDTTNSELFEKFMSISSREEYLKENPHIQAVISASPLVDPVSIGVRKHDNGFKEVLQRIDYLTPGSQLKKTTNI